MRQVLHTTQPMGQTIANKIEVLNAQQYMEVFNGISTDLGNGIIFTDAEKASIGAGTDWQDLVLEMV